MNEPKAQQDPSMEEILASIRRIISEGEGAEEPAAEAAEEAPAAEPPAADEAAPEEIEQQPAPELAPAPMPEPPAAPAAAEPEPEAEDVFDLTNMVSEDGTVVDLAGQPAPQVGPRLEMVDDTPPAESAPAPRPVQRTGAETLIGTDAAGRSSDAFAELAQTVASRSSVDNSLRIANAERTIEDIVREAVRPLLKEWLDRNLPELVRRLVKQEIDRLSRG